MPESHNIEYKSNWRDDYLKWICAFANTKGGRLYVGVDDDGNVIGINNYKQLLEDLPNSFRDVLGIYAEVNLQNEYNKYYLEIVVPGYDVPISLRGKYYIRVGSTIQELKGTALNEFILKRTGRTWDDLPEAFATLDDVDEKAVHYFVDKAVKSRRIYSEAVGDSIKILLENLHLFQPNGKLKKAAILLFGIDPQKFFTNAYFKIGRFGESDSDLKYQDVIDGNIIEMPNKVIEMLRSKYLVSPIRYEGIHRVEELEYPEAALREAVLNAIVHKDYRGGAILLSVYEDKLILWNPGTLPEELDIEMLKAKHPSHPRNKNIAEVFFKSGYIESWGRGISMIMNACKGVGIPEPVIEELAGGFQITFYKDIFTTHYLKGLGLKDRQIDAVFYTKQYGEITNSKYQEVADVSKPTATRDINELVKKDVFNKSGTKGSSVVYRLKIGS